MDFPEINGIDEGSVAITIAALISAAHGNNEELWNAPLWVPILNEYYPRSTVLLRVVQVFIWPYAFEGLR